MNYCSDDVRAAIGIRGKDGVIRVITVDKKGYPGFTGAMLLAKYQNKEKVEKLLELGDLKILGEELHPNNNFPHYIVIRGNRRKREIQERVTVANHRDIRVSIDGILIKQKKQVYREYKTEVEVYWGEGVEFVYILDITIEEWITYCIGNQTGRFTDIKVRYRGLINNLIDGEDIEDLTKDEKQYLARYGY